MWVQCNGGFIDSSVNVNSTEQEQLSSGDICLLAAAFYSMNRLSTASEPNVGRLLLVFMQFLSSADAQKRLSASNLTALFANKSAAASEAISKIFRNPNWTHIRKVIFPHYFDFHQISTNKRKSRSKF